MLKLPWSQHPAFAAVSHCFSERAPVGASAWQQRRVEEGSPEERLVMKLVINYLTGTEILEYPSSVGVNHGCKHLSSYNWIEAPTPTFAVPGSPPL